MVQHLLTLKKWMTTVLNWVLILAVFLLVASVVWGVLTRSIGTLLVSINEQTGWMPWSWLPAGQAEWTEELARYLLIWVSLLGGAVAFGTKGHLGVDYFVGKFHPEVQKLMAIFVHGVVLFFAGSVFLYGGWKVAAGAMTQTTQTLAPLMKGHIYLVLPLAGVFMVIYTIENLIETICLSGKEADDVGAE
jgi:TRAP-type C4-dicarboxylate transport system permease small subunit